MANNTHSALTGAELHVPGYVQSSDPGAVGAGKLWVDTALGVGNYVVKLRSAANTGWETVSAAPSGYLFGLSLSNNISDPTNDLDIAIGRARDSTNVCDLALASALTKRLDAAWAVGTNQGSLDTGSIANTTYHVWLIGRADTGVVDVLFSASATAPTLPVGYGYKRRIGSFIRTGGAIKPFVQLGDEFLWKTPVIDVNVSNPGSSAVTRTLTLPTGISVRAILDVGAADNAGELSGVVSSLDIDDQTPQDAVTTTALTGFSNFQSMNPIGGWEFNALVVRANTSAQVRSRLSTTGASDRFAIVTRGWWDSRGKDS